MSKVKSSNDVIDIRGLAKVCLIKIAKGQSIGGGNILREHVNAESCRVYVGVKV